MEPTTDPRTTDLPAAPQEPAARYLPAEDPAGPAPAAPMTPPVAPLPPLAPLPPAAPLPPVGDVPPPPSGSTGPAFTLRRSRTDRMLGGVCGGLARSLGVDAALLRIALVLLTVFGFGVGAVAYVAAWILAPEEDPAGA